jgi:hypothetical protein
MREHYAYLKDAADRRVLLAGPATDGVKDGPARMTGCPPGF